MLNFRCSRIWSYPPFPTILLLTTTLHSKLKDSSYESTLLSLSPYFFRLHESSFREQISWPPDLAKPSLKLFKKQWYQKKSDGISYFYYFFYNRIPSLLSIYSLILPSPFSYSLSFHFPKLSLNHNTSALKPNQNQPCFKWLRCLLIKIMCEMETFTKFEKNSGFFLAFTKKKISFNQNWNGKS